MIWLEGRVAQCLDHTVEGLRRALQHAIELEHATIPPYLYALYSLKPGANTKIASLIRSVVVEEMLHMSLVCNILNAIGGSPCIDSPDFIPVYPGRLPGTVENQLIVPLSPFSKDLIENIFMVIEEPEKPLEFPVVPVENLSLLAEPPKLTIGQFYALIQSQIVELAKKQRLFTGEGSLQLKTAFHSIPLTAVTDVDSALAALTLIVDQGEGTTTSPLDGEKEPAHYYRFAEIFHGYSLIPNPHPSPGAPPFVYGGDPIPFDATGVWPAMVNPHSSSYREGSRAAIANRTFNQTYTQMLKCLHAVFNGTPDRIATAVLAMEALRQQAGYLMSLEIGDCQTAGPTFEFCPGNS